MPDLVQGATKPETHRLTTVEQQQALQSLVHHCQNDEIDRPALWRMVTQAATSILGAQHAAVWCYTHNDQELMAEDIFDRSGHQHTHGMVIKRSRFKGLFKQASDNRLWVVDDAEHDSRFTGAGENGFLPGNVIGVLITQIIWNHRPLGLLCISHNDSGRRWLPREQHTAISLSDLVSTTLEQMRHREMRHNFEEVASELRMQKFSMDQHAIVSITDDSGFINYVNDKFCEISGYTRVELVGRYHNIINSDYHSKAFFQDMWATLRKGDIWRGEIRNQAKDGHYYWVDSTIVPFRDTLGNGEIYQYVSIRTDITKLAETREALRRSNVGLETRVNEQIRKLQDAQGQLLQSEKLASIGQLAAGVAHEINNPVGYVYSNIGTLKTYIDNLFELLDAYQEAEKDLQSQPELLARLRAAREKADLNYLRDDLSDLLRESQEGVTRVKQIVQDLKDFSHVDEADWYWADLHKGLDSTLNIAHNEIKYKATIIKEYGDIPEIECMPSQLNQVFMNLLVNAAHAIEEFGTITVRTGTEKDQVWVEIEDTGKGIAPEHMNKIFDPFFTTKPVGMGTGLGLSMSYGIVQKHGGHIKVRSEQDKGTTFRITLPCQQTGERAEDRGKQDKNHTLR